MSPGSVFFLILLATFVVLIFATQPSKTEKAVKDRLMAIERSAIGLDNVEATDILKREVLSDVEWLDEFMQRFPVFLKLHELLAQAESNWNVGTLILISLGLGIFTGWLVTFRVDAIGLALIVGVLAASAPYAYLLVKRARRFNRFEELLPDAIDLMARALRAGHTVTAGIEMVSQEVPEPISSEFRRVFEEQNFGLPLREAMLNLSKRIPLPDVNFLVTAVLVQKETGGNLAEVLDKTTAVIRERFRLKGQLRIYTAQGRLTGWILAAMPFALFVVLYTMNPTYEGVLITDPLGRKLVYVGLGMMAVGGYVIRRIIQIKV